MFNNWPPMTGVV